MYWIQTKTKKYELPLGMQYTWIRWFWNECFKSEDDDCCRHLKTLIKCHNTVLSVQFLFLFLLIIFPAAATAGPLWIVNVIHFPSCNVFHWLWNENNVLSVFLTPKSHINQWHTQNEMFGRFYSSPSSCCCTFSIHLNFFFLFLHYQYVLSQIIN